MFSKKFNEKTIEKIKSFIYVTIGVMISSFAFSFFLNPNNIVIGGVSGISVIIKERFNGFDPSLAMLILNGILLFISLFLIGKEFFIKTVYGAIMFPIFAFFFNLIYKAIESEMVSLTNDLVLIILFSSIIMGYGLGIAVKHGGSTGGTEIPQKIMYDKMHIPYTVSLLFIDGAVITIGYILIKQDIRIVLYEIVFMVLCGIVMDTTIFSGFNKRCVHIISEKIEEIKEILLKDFSRGVTGVRVTGEYTNSERKMLICLLSSLEYNKIRELVEKIDPYAFFYCVRASEVRGEGFTYDNNPKDRKKT